jgi:hypothetical protein
MIELTGLAAESVNLTHAVAQDLPFAAESTWLTIWVCLGTHLTDDKSWLLVPEEVRRTLEPGEFFLLFEALVDGNPNTRIGEGKNRLQHISERKRRVNRCFTTFTS